MGFCPIVSNTATINAKPLDKPSALTDERGLSIQIQPTGGKWWRLLYRFDGKAKMLSLGVYPDVSLKEARERALARSIERFQILSCPEFGVRYNIVPQSNDPDHPLQTGGAEMSSDRMRNALARVVTCFATMGLIAVATAQSAETPDHSIAVDSGSFRCIRQMTPVRHFFVGNLLGQIDATLAAANSKSGAIYPVGSVVQLVPTEAMVKREKNFNPATGDWEFFDLDVSPDGTRIRTRGFAEVNNRFGKNCFVCHVPAREPWDFICESGHGCEPIPIDHAMTGALQRSDPRCGPAVLQSGDSWALWKLRAIVLIGGAIGWAKNLF